MKKYLNELTDKLHTLSNQLTVIEKAMSVYEKNLPEHKLTQISKNAMDGAIDEIKNIKRIVVNMLEDKEEGQIIIDNPQLKNEHDEKVLIDFMQFKMQAWQDNYNLKIVISPHQFQNKHTYIINLNEMRKIVEDFLNCSSLAKSKLVEINFAATDEFLAVNLSDNAEINNEDSLMCLNNLKNKIPSLAFECRINSMQGIGNGIIMRFPIKK